MPATSYIDPDGSLFETICARIEEGESLRGICSEKGMPTATTVIAWKESTPEKLARYTRARLFQARVYAERITEVAENVLNGLIEPDAARVAIDAFKWTAAKLHPGDYGDKTASPTVNVAVGVNVMTPEHLADLAARKRASIERRRKGESLNDESAPRLSDSGQSQAESKEDAP